MRDKEKIPGRSGLAKSVGGGRVDVKTYTLFHGSPRTDITEFDISKAGTNTETGEKFLFFTYSKQVADEFSYERLASESIFFNTRRRKGRVYEVDVIMHKPLDMTNLSDNDIRNLISLSGGDLDADMIRRFSNGNNQLLKTYIKLDDISKYGYDGFIARMNRNGDKEYAVLSNKQVKIKSFTRTRKAPHKKSKSIK